MSECGRVSECVSGCVSALRGLYVVQWHVSALPRASGLHEHPAVAVVVVAVRAFRLHTHTHTHAYMHT